MTRIVTVTLNPALDVSTEVETVRPGTKLRCADPRVDPGGGGVNISRAIRQLGGRSLAAVAATGPNGRQVMELLAVEGVTATAIPAPGPSRMSLAVTETSSGEQFRFVMPGPEWDAATCKAVENRLDDLLSPGDILCLSGSGARGAPKDFYLALARRAGAAGARTLLDTSGTPLRVAAEATDRPLTVLRMDGEEAEELAGRPHASLEDLAAFGRKLVERGAAEMAVIARGAEGSVLVRRDGPALHARPPEVEVVSPVGAGDSFVGAFVLSLARDESPERALVHGVAAAAAAVQTPGTRLCELEETERLRATIEARPLG